MKYITGVILISLVASSTILARKSIPSDAQLVEERYSFETDFEGWTAHATDVNPNLPSPVSRSQVIAEDGANSLQLLSIATPRFRTCGSRRSSTWRHIRSMMLELTTRWALEIVARISLPS